MAEIFRDLDGDTYSLDDLIEEIIFGEISISVTNEDVDIDIVTKEKIYTVHIIPFDKKNPNTSIKMTEAYWLAIERKIQSLCNVNISTN